MQMDIQQARLWEQEETAVREKPETEQEKRTREQDIQQAKL